MAAKKTEPEVVVNEEKPKNDWGGKLIWGTLFVAAGVILLLSNLDIVSIEWSSLWKLWPVLVIVAGLSILSLRGWVGKVVYILTALAIAVVAWLVLTGEIGQSTVNAESQDFNISRSDESVKKLDLTVDSGASSLVVGSHNGGELVKGVLESRTSELNQRSETDGDTHKVKLSFDRQWLDWRFDKPDKLNVDITKKVPTKLTINAGASSVDADLSAIMLESAVIDSGASSVKLKLGDKMKESNIDIDTGASSVDLEVPSNVGVKLVFDEGLSSKDLPNGFKEIDSKTYQSENFDKQEKKINIYVDMGVSSFKLNTY